MSQALSSFDENVSFRLVCAAGAWLLAVAQRLLPRGRVAAPAATRTILDAERRIDDVAGHDAFAYMAITRQSGSGILLTAQDLRLGPAGIFDKAAARYPARANAATPAQAQAQAQAGKRSHGCTQRPNS